MKIPKHQNYISLTLSFNILLLLSQYVEGNMDYFKAHELDLTPQFWSNSFAENTSLNLGVALGCNFCGDVFYHAPPPEDILFIPPPPMHPSYQSSFGDVMSSSGKQTNDQCNYCNLFYSDDELLVDVSAKDVGSRLMAMLIALSAVSAILCLYILGTRRSKIVSLTRVKLFKTGPQQPSARQQPTKASSSDVSINNASTHLADPCFLQTNRDKNLTSPIISDHVPHKKTSIPSKYWSQPGSIIGRTMRRIPNEYEIPSSRTNSTGTSSAVYADMNNETNQRFFSPYNLHTYAEVREILDEHFHTSSNSSAMLSDSNYDNGTHQQHGSCVMNGGNLIATAPNGSVQMSDFNSMRPMPQMNYVQPNQISHHLQINTQPNSSQHQLYEQPPQRAQVIITSNNQGVNPSLLNYKGRIHNVI